MLKNLKVKMTLNVELFALKKNYYCRIKLDEKCQTITKVKARQN